jgi:hypothetical protein
MQQKTTWMRYLTLGISVMIIFALLQCKGEVDYFVQGTYVYVNSTDSLIDVKSGVYNFKIKPNDSHKIEQGGEGSEDVSAQNYVPPMISAVVKYGNEKCDTLDSGFKVGAGEGITGISNYTSEKISKRHYKFTYTFTNLDYNKARPCK